LIFIMMPSSDKYCGHCSVIYVWSFAQFTVFLPTTFPSSVSCPLTASWAFMVQMKPNHTHFFRRSL
jgi:hypothetical protein